MRPQIFFFRGLSTYGSDHAQWSIFNFGPLHGAFERAFAERGVDFHPVLGMGAGQLEVVAARALALVEAHPAWRSAAPVHFLGHSAGGLVARLVLHELEKKAPGRVASLLTIASPHAGSRLADVCLGMHETHAGSARLLRTFGYDLRDKRAFFEDLGAANVARLFTKHAPQAECGSIVAWSPRKEWCAPLKMFYRVHAFRDMPWDSDGVVERDTQPFGRVIAELPIDHFRQVGLFGEAHRFARMCDVAVDYFKANQR